MSSMKIFFFAFLLCFSASPISAQIQHWCISVIGAPAQKMQGFLDFVCGKYDCSAINPGGQCYEPNTLVLHTSYALSLYYRATRVCNLEIGQIVFTNPSSSSCTYP